MIEAAKELVQRYQALPERERQQVLAVLLQQAGSEIHELPDDEDLTAAADRVFQDLDRREQER